VAGEPITVQVMHLGATPLRLTTDMTVGSIDPNERQTYEVFPDEFKERDGTAKEEKDFPLPEGDASSLHDAWSGALGALFLFKKHALLWGGKLERIRGVEHFIRLKPGAVFVRQHSFKAGPSARKREKSEFKRLRWMGVIEPFTGQWARAVVTVPKPDGSVRFCIDYGKLKLMTVKDAYPIPGMDECIHSLGDARVFSTREFKAGY